MIHKILAVGDSAAVTIPKYILTELGLKRGDAVTLHHDAHEGSIRIVPVRPVKTRIRKKTVRYLEEFMREYASVLQKLAQH